MTFRTLLVESCLAGVLGQIPGIFQPPVTHPNPPPLDAYTRQQQAGCPNTIAWWAIPSDCKGFTVSLVGGGCPCPQKADPPRPDEGTWGWDFLGRFFKSNVLLGWWHERRYQGGSGAYQTEGPTLNHGEGTLKSWRDR